ncbi:jordan transposition protein, partial [Volvox carteri f. nagariensis]
MTPSGTFMQIRDLYLQKRQIGQRLKREVFNFACELAQCRAGETFIVIVDGIEWVATVPRRSKPDDLVSMRFSAGNQVERTLVGMLGSGAKEESLKRYIREGLAMKTNEYKERIRGMSHDAALVFVRDHIRHTTPAQGQIGREDNMMYHWPMRPWTRLYDEAASAADRTMTTGNEEALKAGEEVVTSGGAEGGDAAMVDPEEDARGGRAAMPSPRFPCAVRQQEEDARGGRAAMPSPRFPCAVRQQ